MAFASWRNQSHYARLRHMHSTPAARHFTFTVSDMEVTPAERNNTEKQHTRGPTETESRGHSIPRCMTSVGTSRFQSRLHCKLQLYTNAWAQAGADIWLRTLGLMSAATRCNCILTKDCYRAMAMADITVIDFLVCDTKYTQHEAFGFFLVPSGNCCASAASRTKNVFTYYFCFCSLIL